MSTPETNSITVPTPAPPAPWYVKTPGARPEQGSITVDEKQVINRQGKDFVLYAGLLDAAHKAGLQSIRTQLVQCPASLNGETAIVHATAEFAWGSFDGIGDANPSNVSRNIAPHLIRMAETRAKARALRDALSIGMVAAEEMGPEPGEQPAKPTTVSTPRDEARAPYGHGPGAGAQPRKTYGTVMTKPAVEGDRNRWPSEQS